MVIDVQNQEKSSCGVGFLVSLNGESTNENLRDALKSLSCQEHRGGCSYDKISSDGSGIMTDIPYELFGIEKGTMAIATLFIPLDSENQRIALKVLYDTFKFLDLEIEKFRDVPIDTSILGSDALRSLPAIKQVFIKKPKHCRTDFAFNRLLYMAKQLTRKKASERGLKEFFYTSISTNTIVYKALTRANMLDKFYLDLQNPKYKTRFTIFHRRFSTNTQTSWDKAQPFRVIAHNGEINTISGNRSWGYSREKAMGLKDEELLSHKGISDTGTLNEMTEALLYRSSIPHLEEVMSIMIPPATNRNKFYRFWSRAMEAWDGPAAIIFSNGNVVGARLDRNGFRPCRWAKTGSHFYLSSEAGSFELNEENIIAKGALYGGTGLSVEIETGEVSFVDPSISKQNENYEYDPHLIPIKEIPISYLREKKDLFQKAQLFSYTQEDVTKIMIPMIVEGKEPIGSMGDTARLAIFSDEPRSFFDYFSQNFAQVTNPPVDYLREGIVVDLKMNLGKKPNIFSPKELIPMPTAFELNSPVVSLSQMEFLKSLENVNYEGRGLKVKTIYTTFKKSEGEVGFRSAMKRIQEEVVQAVSKGATIIVLSDSNVNHENYPIPSLIALRLCVYALSIAGIRLDASLMIHSAEVRTTHHVSTLVGFGATAVCPYLALEFARFYPDEKLNVLSSDEKEKHLIKAFEQGLLKVMSKMGISVARSYESTKLFSVLGLGNEITQPYFREIQSPIDGIDIATLVEQITSQIEKTNSEEYRETLINTYQYKEHARGLMGEKHSMTSARSKLVHKLVRDTGKALDNPELFNEYLKVGDDTNPITIRHLFDFKKNDSEISVEDVDGKEHILKTFGSGGMSFGAISAESQKDIFLAMKEIGGRSNSGEGGENPYYFKDGISATTKQVASGRFGVTAEYLIGAREIQIKVAQGAKPGEGGQLMSVKVTEDIARARHAKTGIDLISPPPLHDIYSIEDLKGLIYELKQLNPDVKVCVKLVSGANIGTIAVGVAKAGADVIHVSGWDGGTGAASLSSMKHAGLPWEIGLWEVHTYLVKNKLRRYVKLRTDGGLASGKDVIMAAILGAEEYDFGRLLLVAQGCIMARICELNTCPTGIATHDPKFKAKYKGTSEHIVKILTYIAEDARGYLAKLGVSSLKHIIGRTDLIEVSAKHSNLVLEKNLNFEYFFTESLPEINDKPSPYAEELSSLNKRLLQEIHASIVDEKKSCFVNSEIYVYDRAALATVSGEIAKKIRDTRYSTGNFSEEPAFDFDISVNFKGSAGQGFGVFLNKGINVYLKGEANDSVCKSMSGGKVVITLPNNSKLKSNENVIIGNCALYGATGGTLYVCGIAGDRFAVRNSGATAVVEGVGLHACEYMTAGTVVILGDTWHNVGAGMTGGKLILYGNHSEYINHQYIKEVPFDDGEKIALHELLQDYADETNSGYTKNILGDWNREFSKFHLFLPVKESVKYTTTKEKVEAV